MGEDEFQALSDDGLKQKTEELRKRANDGESLDDLLPEAFANCREGARRTLGLRAFDTQLMSAIFLHQGNISEQKTGEGKTLTATLAAYLNALTGKGVHIVTVNEYLVQRDADWMGKVFASLGLTTGAAVSGMTEDDKRAAYSCDVTYATNNELGFDYLRDNMKSELSQIFQKHHNFAIVDEVDSILIDEARTPLIISGPSQDRSDLYVKINQFIPELKKEDYEKDEKSKSVNLTDKGVEKMEKTLTEKKILKNNNLFDSYNMVLVHHINQALRAHKLFEKNTDYIVKNNEVII